MIVEQQTATVFRGGGRRFFTKRAAYRAAAKAKINEYCDCDPGDPATGEAADICEYHEDMDKWERLVTRLARFYQYRDCQGHDHE